METMQDLAPALPEDGCPVAAQPLRRRGVVLQDADIRVDDEHGDGDGVEHDAVKALIQELNRQTAHDALIIASFAKGWNAKVCGANLGVFVFGD
jgi:hypothetical protein